MWEMCCLLRVSFSMMLLRSVKASLTYFSGNFCSSAADGSRQLFRLLLLLKLCCITNNPKAPGHGMKVLTASGCVRLITGHLVTPAGSLTGGCEFSLAHWSRCRSDEQGPEACYSSTLFLAYSSCFPHSAGKRREERHSCLWGPSLGLPTVPFASVRGIKSQTWPAVRDRETTFLMRQTTNGMPRRADLGKGKAWASSSELLCSASRSPLSRALRPFCK